MKNLKDLNGNRTRDLPACSVVLTTTALPRTSSFKSVTSNYTVNITLSDLVYVVVTAGGRYRRSVSLFGCVQRKSY
jgi:hypothetical protein